MIRAAVAPASPTSQPCPDCGRGARLESFVASHRERCEVCGAERFVFDMDHGQHWERVIPGDVIRAALAGEVGPLAERLADERMALPIQDGRPYAELCASYHPDLTRWAEAFARVERPGNAWILERYVQGVGALLHEAEAGAAPAPPRFVESTPWPAGAGDPRLSALVRADGDRLLVQPRDSSWVWERGRAPRRAPPWGAGGPSTAPRAASPFDELRARELHAPDRVVPVGSERRYLVVSAEAVSLHDAGSGAATPARDLPPHVERLLGVEAHGGVYVTAGLYVGFFGPGAWSGWRVMPFPVHPTYATFPDRVVLSCAANRARSVVLRRAGEDFELEGAVVGARAARFPRTWPYHLAGPAAGPPVFTGPDGWFALAWPG